MDEWGREVWDEHMKFCAELRRLRDVQWRRDRVGLVVVVASMAATLISLAVIAGSFGW